MSGKLSFAVWFCKSLLIEACRVYLLKKVSQMSGKTLFLLSQTVIQWCILPPHHPLPPSFLVFSCLPHWYSILFLYLSLWLKSDILVACIFISSLYFHLDPHLNPVLSGLNNPLVSCILLSMSVVIRDPDSLSFLPRCP